MSALFPVCTVFELTASPTVLAFVATWIFVGLVFPTLKVPILEVDPVVEINWPTFEPTIVLLLPTWLLILVFELPAEIVFVFATPVVEIWALETFDKLSVFDTLLLVDTFVNPEFWVTVLLVEPAFVCDSNKEPELFID